MKKNLFYTLCLCLSLFLGGCIGDELDQERLILSLNTGLVDEPPYKTISKNNLLEGTPIIVTDTFQFKLLRLFADEKNVCVITSVTTNNDAELATDLYDLEETLLNHQFKGEIVNAVSNAQGSSWIDCFPAPPANNDTLTILVGDLDGDKTGESAEFTIYLSK